MNRIKLFFNAYIHHSYHVALMVLSYTGLSFILWDMPMKKETVLLPYFLAFMAYTGVKLFPFNRSLTLRRKGVIGLHFAAAIFLFLMLDFFQMGAVVVAFFLTVLYCIPLPFASKSWRYQPPLKILIVALCWGLLTVVFPWGVSMFSSVEVMLYFVQRVLLVFVAVLPFEIVDLHRDEAQLGTLPQRFGVLDTKKIGYWVVGLAVCLQLWLLFSAALPIYPELLMSFLYALFLWRSQPNRSPLFTLFWVEAVPLVGLLILIIFDA